MALRGLAPTFNSMKRLPISCRKLRLAKAILISSRLMQRGFDLVREYVDVGQSGAKDSRPELNILMGDARKRQFDAIVVWRFDRFARSTKHLLMALEEFRFLGIQFISYQENMDTSSPLGQALFTIVSAVAQLERDLIRERVTAGIRNARANGKQLGRPRRIVDREQILQLKA